MIHISTRYSNGLLFHAVTCPTTRADSVPSLSFTYSTRYEHLKVGSLFNTHDRSSCFAEVLYRGDRVEKRLAAAIQLSRPLALSRREGRPRGRSRFGPSIGVDPVDPSGLIEAMGDRDIESLHGSGAVDHIAFFAVNLLEVRETLTRLGVPYRERTVPTLKVHQMFLEDPSGLVVELNFPFLDENEGADA